MSICGKFKMADGSEMEPFDVERNKRIDDVLIPELDDAILRVAKLRKIQPRKCRSIMRNIAISNVQYYSKVHVKVEPKEPVLLNVDLPGILAEHDTMLHMDFTSFAKSLTDVVEKRTCIKKVLKVQQGLQVKGRQLNLHPKRMTKLKLTHLYNPDFVINEKRI